MAVKYISKTVPFRQSNPSSSGQSRDFQTIAGKLLVIHEEQRRRLARQLHDDFSQRLALLAINIGTLQAEPVFATDNCQQKFQQLRNQVIELSTDLHHISRQLHPTIIDDLGLIRAIESQCRVFSKINRIGVEFGPEEELPAISRDISVCLFRVIQEALLNISRHAETDRVQVELFSGKESVNVAIVDHGRGFDRQRCADGMGITAMEQRVKLLKGKFSIISLPGRGTCVNAAIPLAKVNTFEE
jgi:signal transduction histidine kinase